MGRRATDGRPVDCRLSTVDTIPTLLTLASAEIAPQPVQ